MRRRLALVLIAGLLTGCLHVKLDPIQVHATVDVNVKVEQAVTNLLSDIYGDSATVNTSSAASTPAAR
jgi:hypothetical protein